jgi:hypothetical protein
MAKRTIHVLVDDLDGGDADETVSFAFEGIQYEIDLSKKNAEKLRDAMAQYVAAATKLGHGQVQRVTGRRGSAPVNGNADQNRAIREWALAQGLPVSDRGRIKQEIVDQFHDKAGRSPSRPPAPASV